MPSQPDFATASPKTFETMSHMGAYLTENRCGAGLRNQVDPQVSRIKGSAYGIDVHRKVALNHGESEARLHALGCRHESPLFSERERAALAWAEALTFITDGLSPDAVYEQARSHFGDRDLAGLALVIVGTNSRDRLCIASRTQPGNRRPEIAHTQRRMEAAW